MIFRVIRQYIKNYFFTKKNIKVGSNTRILTSINNFGSEPYLIEIGNNCTITSGVKFITHDASVDVALRYKNKKRVIDGKKYEILSRIKVQDNCMIGSNSIILPNVNIGPNSIIGAGSVVTKDVPEGVVVAGNPAKVICSLDEYAKKINSQMILIPQATNVEERKNLILREMK
jgi:acetyltransferase-like isoleucine patch superfamily enzyme